MRSTLVALILIVTSVAIFVALFFAAKMIVSLNRRRLEKRVRDELKIPFPDNTIDSFAEERLTRSFLKKMSKLADSVHNISLAEDCLKLKKEIADQKLEFMYMVPFLANARNSSDSIQEIQNIFAAYREADNINLMRQDKSESQILAGEITEEEREIDGYSSDIERIKDAAYSDMLKEVKESSTKILFMQSLIRNKIRESNLRDLSNQVRLDFDKMQQLGKRANEILQYVRYVAFRNIYLGVELLGFIRNNVGGQSLNTEKDSLNIDLTLESHVSSLKIEKTNISDSFDSFFRDFSNTAQTLSGFKIESRKAEMIAVIVALLDSLNEIRTSKIKNSARRQRAYLKDLERNVPKLELEKAAFLRAIEIIRAMIETNKGFISIYAPLRDKVFIEGSQQNISLQDINMLAQAVSEYNKLSHSKI